MPLNQYNPINKLTMKKTLIFFIFLLTSFCTFADSYDEIMYKSSLTYKDLKTLYNSPKPEHVYFANNYFKLLVNGIIAYDSMLILEHKNRFACPSNYDYLMKLTILSETIKMIDDVLKQHNAVDHLYEQPFSLLYLKVLKYNYPCSE